jgi:hypothetical protein
MALEEDQLPKFPLLTPVPSWSCVVILSTFLWVLNLHRQLKLSDR